MPSGSGGRQANLVADTGPCSAARSAVAGAAVPGERALAVASQASPSKPCARTEGVAIVLDDAVQFAGQHLGLP
jgi:hypothetical protein